MKSKEIKDKVKIEDYVNALGMTIYSSFHYKIARDNYGLAESLRENNDLLGENEASLVSILFSFFSIEARINEIIFEKIPEKMRDNYEWLNIDKKIIIVSNLLSKKEFNEEIWNSYKQLKRLRDSFVHTKSRFMKAKEHPTKKRLIGGKHRLCVENSKFACDTACRVIRHLEEICGVKKIGDFDITVGKGIRKTPIN